MKLQQLLWILVFGVLLPALPASSADITREADLITLSGEIRPGDLSNIAKLVFEGQTVGEARPTLSLNSDGGSFSEGLAIAKLVHDNEIGTIVTRSNRCNSACALIFLGGTYGEAEEVKSEPDRTLEVGAQLGFHAPFPAEGQKPTSEADLTRLRAVLEKFDVPGALMPLLLRNDALHSLYDATSMEAIELLQITIEGTDGLPTKLTRNMAVNSCINGHRYAQSQLPSMFRDNDRQVFDAINRLRPLALHEEGENKFVLVPALKLSSGGDAFCKIDAQGACSGIFNMNMLATYSEQDAQISELNQCQRMNALTPLVDPVTKLADISRVLAVMQQQEAAVLNGIPSTVDLPPGGEEGAEVLAKEQVQPTQKRVVCNLRRDENQMPTQFANIRQGPSGKTALVVSLPNMTPIEIIGQAQNPDTNHLWWKIRSGNSVGFVDNELVAESCLIAGPVPTPAARIKPPAYQPRDAVVCNRGGDSANVRTAPNPKTSQIISKIFNREPLTIIGETNNPDSGELYFQVRANGVEGYIYGALVSGSCDLEQQTGNGSVTCNPSLAHVNLRTGPNADMFDIIAEVPNSTPVEVLEQTTNPVSGHIWLKIRAGGNVGFVDAEKVRNGC